MTDSFHEQPAKFSELAPERSPQGTGRGREFSVALNGKHALPNRPEGIGHRVIVEAEVPSTVGAHQPQRPPCAWLPAGCQDRDGLTRSLAANLGVDPRHNLQAPLLSEAWYGTQRARVSPSEGHVNSPGEESFGPSVNDPLGAPIVGHRLLGASHHLRLTHQLVDL